MKKLLIVLFAIALCLSACAEGAMNVVALKGPTAMGLVKLMSEEKSEYQFSIISAVDEVAPKLLKGEADVACVPANLGSVLYNNADHSVQVLAINTLGVLYIVESGDQIHSVADLQGHTIYASGKGATPEYALNYILKLNDVQDVTIEWKSEHAECLNALMTNPGSIAMLPQPFVTTAQMKAEGLRVALDLTEEWEKSDADSTMITGAVVVRREYAEAHPEELSAFMDDYKASVDFVNANTADAAALVGQYDIVPEAVAQKALPECNITFIEGEEMREKLEGYLKVLFDAEPKSVGGALPEDDFYYIR